MFNETSSSVKTKKALLNLSC